MNDLPTMATPTDVKPFRFSHAGTCPTCDGYVNFIADGPFFRSTLACDKCGSRPRSRAIMHVLSTRFPNWKDLAIHESSPGWDMVSQRLVNECRSYTASHYDLTVPFGETVNDVSLPCKSYRSEDLEKQTFGDESFDLVLTQDVFEHIMHPGRAIAEIARTLKPGGATIMTVPIVRKHNRSQRRARMVAGEIDHLQLPEYHGNPLRDGSLVTIDWGYDILHYLQAHSNLMFILIQVDNIDLGIRADLNDVIIGLKASIPDLA